MKRYILLALIIFVVGAAIIIVPRVYEHSVDISNAKGEQDKRNSFLASLGDIQSNADTIETPETVQQEGELYNPEQMYFENFDLLFDYLVVSKIDQVKQSIQFYIQTTIGEDSLDCRLDKESVWDEMDFVSFNVYCGDSSFGVVASKAISGESIIVDTVERKSKT